MRELRTSGRAPGRRLPGLVVRREVRTRQLLRTFLVASVALGACARPALTPPPEPRSVARQPSPAAPAVARTTPPGPEDPSAPSPQKARPEAPPVEPRHFPLPHLNGFYERLERLAAGEETGKIRILWLGDSHTAADFLTDTVRSRLWRRYRSGGPGFVHVGLEGYRQARVASEHAGRFRRQPVAPSTQLPTSDGVFGYGGIRTVPLPGATFRLRPISKGPLEITLGYRRRPGDSFSVAIAGQAAPLEQNVAGEPGVESIHHARWTAPTYQDWVVQIRSETGAPEFFGLDLETPGSGVLLDTVGINGARLGTVLAWQAEAYEAELSWRAPELVVISFGTNEAFDRREPTRYASDLAEVVGRVRAAVPHASFWIHGPPESQDKTSAPNPRVEPITAVLRDASEALGCAFTSQAELMANEGGFAGWKAHVPPWARPDNIHLTVDGYRALGDRLADVLLGESEAPAAAPTELSRLAPPIRRDRVGEDSTWRLSMRPEAHGESPLEPFWYSR